MKLLAIALTALFLSGCAVGWSENCDLDNVLCYQHWHAEHMYHLRGDQ